MKAKTVLIIIAATCVLLFVFYGKNEGPIVDEVIVDAVKDSANAEGDKALEPSEQVPQQSETIAGPQITLAVGGYLDAILQDGESVRDERLEIISVDTQPMFSQAVIRTRNGGEGILTVGKSNVNVFLQTASGSFEYSGPESELVLAKSALTNLANDIYPQPLVKLGSDDE